MKDASNSEGNFDEACNLSYLASALGAADEEGQQVLQEAAGKVLTPSLPSFWVIARALHDFAATEGEGQLPLSATVPDMTSTTGWYVQLQDMFKKKAEEDCAAVSSRVAALLASVGLPADHISAEEVQVMCRNARFLRVIRQRPLAASLAKGAAGAGGAAAASGDAAAGQESMAVTRE